MMWASGATLLPTSGDAPAMDGTGVKEVLQMLQNLWKAGAIPESAQGDTGAGLGRLRHCLAQGQPSRD